MGAKSHLYKAILLWSLIAVNQAIVSPAMADDALAPLHFIGLYDFDFGSVPLGRVALFIDEGNDDYKIRLVVASAGIVNLFTRHVSDTVATGRRRGDSYLPAYYESYYKTKNKPRHIKLEFNNQGTVTTEINEPPEDRNDRPEVLHSLKDGAYDPLTGLMALRANVRVLRAFDAKRLYDVKATDCSKDTLFVGDKWRKAFSCILSREPLSGLTQKEIKQYKEGEPPLSLAFSDDSRKIPLAVSMPLLFSEVHGVLIRECKEWADCAPEVSVK